MKTLLKSFLILVAASLISSCASIVSTSNWPLTVNTNPNGAKISIIDKNNAEVFKGTSPATLKLKSGAGYFAKQSYKVKLNLDGYPERVIPVECKVNGWYIGGNFIIGGFLGWLIVDPLTGAMYKLDTKVINEDFGQKTSYENPTLQIIDIKDIPYSMKEHLVCINK